MKSRGKSHKRYTKRFRDLLGKLIVASLSNRDIDEDIIGTYELSDFPRSLCVLQKFMNVKINHTYLKELLSIE